MDNTLEQMKHIRMDLTKVVYKCIEDNEYTNFSGVNICELSTFIEMIEDISKAIYYSKLSDEIDTTEATAQAMNTRK